MKNEESTALAHPPTTPYSPRLAGGGDRVVGGCAKAIPVWPTYYRGRNAILTQSLHLKYTCCKRTVSNSTSLYTLFYSVIYNSVIIIISVLMGQCQEIFDHRFFLFLYFRILSLTPRIQINFL